MEPLGSIASLKIHKGERPVNALGDNLDAVAGTSLDRGIELDALPPGPCEWPGKLLCRGYRFRPDDVASLLQRSC